MKAFIFIPAILFSVIVSGIFLDPESTTPDPPKKASAATRYMYYNSLFPAYEHTGRTTPTIKKEHIMDAASLEDIAPDLLRSMAIFPYNERIELERRLHMDYPEEYNHSYPKEEEYLEILDYVSVQISVTAQGKVLTAEGPTDKLTAEQKNILDAADLGTDVIINLAFRYKKELAEGADHKIIKGKLATTIIPEKEAEYPGGFKKLNDYLIGHIINTTGETVNPENNVYAVVKFTVNAEGSVTDGKIALTSGNKDIDQLLLNAVHNMPKWKPAENGIGVKVKQEFSIPLGKGGC